MFRTHHDLPESTRVALVTLLNARLADAVDLQAQCKQAHWNVKGPHFIALHKLFDELHATVGEHVDLLAERAVQLGGVADGEVRSVARRSTLPAYPISAVSGEQHLEALADALAAFGRSMRAAIDTCGSQGDQGSADLCTLVSRAIDKALWFVEAHQQTAAALLSV